MTQTIGWGLGFVLEMNRQAIPEIFIILLLDSIADLPSTAFDSALTEFLAENTFTQSTKNVNYSYLLTIL
jgi:hypothetical protein